MKKSQLNIIKTKLKNISAKKGNIMHGLKKNEKSFKKFGEVYFSYIKKNHIKGWKKHKKMTLNLVVPLGKVKFVFISENLLTYREEIIGENQYYRLTVPKNLWFSFKGISKNKSLVVNIASIPHDSSETINLPLKKINYKW